MIFLVVIPDCVAKGSRLNLGGLPLEVRSLDVVFWLATDRSRPHPFATRRRRPFGDSMAVPVLRSFAA